MVPAARVAQRFAPRGHGAAPRPPHAAVAIEHGRSGAAAGRRALHVHQGAAGAGPHTQGDKKRTLESF